jgi:UDP-N-acetylmuramoyl-L-alanyl-D-glutamate--2,6-diaminopimelate ligase
MPTLPLSTLLENAYKIPKELERDITGLTLDSRAVQAGDLFFAFPGLQLDGREFIAEAVSKGAAAILAEADSQEVTFLKNIPVIPIKNLKFKIGAFASVFYGQPTQSLRIIGVTGTNGKTSCTYFIAQALAQLNIPCGIIGTLGSGLLGNVQPTGFTTPDAITLQAIFANLLAQGAQVVAMEVSSHSIDLGRIEGIPFEVAIFTNLTRDHLDYHGDMETYGNVKKRLFDNPYVNHAVINADDAFGATMLSALKETKNLLSYSVSPSATIVPQITADQIRSNTKGLSARIATPWGEGGIQLALMGQFNLSNILAVTAALCLLDIPLDEVLQCMSNLKPVPGRMETVGDLEDAPLVVVDYAHTPDALEKVLLALRQHVPGKLYCIFGCGGDRDKGKRPIMGKIAEQCADVVILTNDNPRHEDPTQIVADILAGISQPEQVIVQHDRSKAIQDIIQCAVAGDGIVVAGKGAETYQQIGDSKIPMNDGEIVKKSLRAADISTMSAIKR